MRKTFPWIATIASLIALVLIVAGIVALRDWRRLRHYCDDAAATELASFSDIFAQSGKHVADFCPKYDFTCKEILQLQYDPPSRSRDDMEKALAGLRGKLRIVDASGAAAFEQVLSPETFGQTWAGAGSDAVLPVIRFSPVPSGDYRIEILVHTPAAILVERPHRLVAGYELCGIEYMAVGFTGLISVACLLIGGLIGFFAIRSLLIRKRRTAKREI